MSKLLVIAEKPSVGKEIGRVLKCSSKNNGYMEGKNWVVTWAFGHLVTLGDPEIYDNRYKNWNLDDLPILPKKLKTKVIPQTGKQYKLVKHLIDRQDINGIVIATDAGREGELVGRWIIEKAGSKKPVKRLWISSVTDKAISEGFKNLKPGELYENLFHAATARAEADWIVGINGSRALTTKHNAQLSLGRVQTPTLSLIMEREEEIKRFVPKEFYGIKAYIKGVEFTYRFKNGNVNTFNKNELENVKDSISNKKFKVISITKKDKKEYSDRLYDLTTLQRDAYNRFGYSPKKTLSIMQNLYETHKALTYPRTDSRYLSEDVADTIKDRLGAIRINPFRKIAFRIMNGKIKISKHFVDSSKVSDHHAIIPTEESQSENSLSFDERNIYDMVVQRFLEVLMEPLEYEETRVTVSADGNNFDASFKNIINIGFKELWKSEDKISNMPTFKLNEFYEVENIKETKGETSPPAYFNEATLLESMENPSKYLDENDGNFKKILKETGGLGTVATRADIIEKLFQSKLMEKTGKGIKVTSKGKQLLALAPEDLKSPLLTAKWEKNLQLIEKGKLKKENFINDMKKYTIKIVDEIRESNKKYKHDNLSGKKCPNCGNPMMIVDNKHGKSLVCVDRDCGYRDRISKITNARCPECHKKLELRGSKDNQLFVCSCGFKESMDSFEKRRKEREKRGSKKDYLNYLKQQEKQNEKENDLNNPFASALAGFKLNK